MAGIIYYATLCFNFSLSLALIVIIRKKITKKGLPVQKGKNLHSFVMVPIGLFSGSFLFWGLTYLFESLGFDITYGHGEIIISAVVFNILLSLILIFFGRIIIDWESILFRMNS